MNTANDTHSKAHNALSPGTRGPTPWPPPWLTGSIPAPSVAPEPSPEPPQEPAVEAPEPVPAVDETETPDWWYLVSDDDLNYLTGPRDWPAPCPWCGGRLHHSEACRKQTESWLPTMPFGKHRGERIGTLPIDYCRFLVAKNIRPRETETVQALETRAGMQYSDKASRLSKRPVDHAKVRAWAAKWAAYHRGGPLPDGVKPHEREERRPAVAEMFERMARVTT